MPQVYTICTFRAYRYFNLTGFIVKVGKKAGYSNAGTPRYVSKDGLRQMRFDTPHMYKGEMIGKHMNLELFKGTKPVPYEHVLYDLFKYWIL